MKKFIISMMAAFACVGLSDVSAANDGDVPAEVGGTVASEVDLGLPSGTRWASHNLGASKAEEPGVLVAWGETVPKADYTWANYKYIDERRKNEFGCNAYTIADNVLGGNWYNNEEVFVGDGRGVLEPDDDAATVNWGAKWKIPSDAQMIELFSECEWQWEVDRNGASGYLVTGPNGNSIFLPAAGGKGRDGKGELGRAGFYWTDTVFDEHSGGAFGLFFINKSNRKNRDESSCHHFLSRYCGFSVRPVVK